MDNEKNNRRAVAIVAFVFMILIWVVGNFLPPEYQYLCTICILVDLVCFIVFVVSIYRSRPGGKYER